MRTKQPQRARARPQVVLPPHPKTGDRVTVFYDSQKWHGRYVGSWGNIVTVNVFDPFQGAVDCEIAALQRERNTNERSA